MRDAVRCLKPPPLESTHIHGVEIRVGSIAKHRGMMTPLIVYISICTNHCRYIVKKLSVKLICVQNVLHIKAIQFLHKNFTTDNPRKATIITT